MTFRGHRYRGSLQVTADTAAERRRLAGRSPDQPQQTYTPSPVPNRSEFSPVLSTARVCSKSQERQVVATRSYPAENKDVRRLMDLRNPQIPLSSAIRQPQLRSLAADSAHLHFNFSHWDEYEQRRQRFTHEYKQFVDHFDAVKQAIAPRKDPPELIGRKDELKALQVVQQREAETKQREVMEELRKRKDVEGVRKALSQQITEKQLTAQYHKDLDKAYAQQIDYRVARTHEIEQNRYMKEIERKKAHQHALLEQISQRSQSRSEFQQVLQEEQTVLHHPSTHAAAHYALSKPAEYRQASVFSQNAAKMLFS